MGDAAMFETVNALTADYRARITELEAARAARAALGGGHG